MRTIVENSVALEIWSTQRTTAFGISYWQTRYSFATGSGSARLHGTTIEFHHSQDAAEIAALNLTKTQGWS